MAREEEELNFIPFLLFSKKKPVWVALVCSAEFVGASGAATELLLTLLKAVTFLVGLELLVVLGPLFVIMVSL